uniref:hypothetical protein n=1 Tax=Paenibacillus terrae TaxID=159743 RepID=UPI001643B10C|nr:hypothetical protein [Paenibacillus terrae]
MMDSTSWYTSSAIAAKGTESIRKKRQRSPLSPNFNRYLRATDQEIWRQQRSAERSVTAAAASLATRGFSSVELRNGEDSHDITGCIDRGGTGRRAAAV